MTTNEERREVAERLRILATHKEVDKELVEDALGLYMGECIDGYDPVSVDDLADLIEPEPRLKCEWYQDEDGNWHTNCGEIFVVCNCESLEDNNIIYCHNCGGVIEVVEK